PISQPALVLSLLLLLLWLPRPPRSTLFPYNDALPISPRAFQDGCRSSGFGDGPAQCLSICAKLPRDCSAIRRRETSAPFPQITGDRKSTRLNSSHRTISYAVFRLKKKKSTRPQLSTRP